MSDGQFRFRNLDSVGAYGAEEDELLDTCFVDTGHLECLQNFEDRRFIVLGRTGAGKSALLHKLHDDNEKTAIFILPDQLSLNYVSNSTILQFFSSIGVNLDPFFKLLWKHVFVIEVLARHKNESPAGRSMGVLEWLKSMLPERRDQERDSRVALEYLEQWRDSFWINTEVKVREITKKVEASLEQSVQARARLTGPAGGLDANAGSAAAGLLSEIEKAEFRDRGQQIVSSEQLAELQKTVTLLEGVLERNRRQYYVLIDRLDENWVDAPVRSRLIMALLECAKEFRRFKCIKIIVGIRRDLIERVFRQVSGQAGFQEEKYQSLYLPVSWTSEQIIHVLDRRVDALVRQRYTRKTVSHVDLLPKTIRGKQVTEFIAERAPRPRDIIAFFNSCIEAAPGLAKLTKREFGIAEGEYSRGRLDALYDDGLATIHLCKSSHGCSNAGDRHLKFVRLLTLILRISAFKLQSAKCRREFWTQLLVGLLTPPLQFRSFVAFSFDRCT